MPPRGRAARQQSFFTAVFRAIRYSRELPDRNDAGAFKRGASQICGAFARRPTLALYRYIPDQIKESYLFPSSQARFFQPTSLSVKVVEGSRSAENASGLKNFFRHFRAL